MQIDTTETILTTETIFRKNHVERIFALGTKRGGRALRKPKSFVTIFAFGNMRNIHAPFAEIYGVPVHAVFRIAGIENQIAVLGVGDIVYKGTAYSVLHI